MTSESPSGVDILVAIARLETKLDEFTKRQSDQEIRLRVIEGRVNRSIPAVGLVGTCMGGLITAIWQALAA